MKPKRALSAYLLYNTAKVAELKKTGVEHKDAFKKAGESWKEMTEKEKEPWEKQQAVHQARYAGQVKELEEKGYFMTEDGVKSTDVEITDPRKKYGKNVLLPKRALSAYFFFTGQNIPIIRNDEKCTHMEAFKLAAAKWGSMADKEKKKYEDLHDKDVKRSDKQLEDLMKNGFFMMEDGSKSSDHSAKIKKKKRSKSANTESEHEDEDADEKPKKIKLQKEKK